MNSHSDTYKYKYISNKKLKSISSRVQTLTTNLYDIASKGIEDSLVPLLHYIMDNLISNPTELVIDKTTEFYDFGDDFPKIIAISILYKGIKLYNKPLSLTIEEHVGIYNKEFSGWRVTFNNIPFSYLCDKPPHITVDNLYTRLSFYKELHDNIYEDNKLPSFKDKILKLLAYIKNKVRRKGE